jgi:tetratricopeptide (TPR) repeat protein
MPAAPNPFQTYLDRATSLFEAGDVVQAGQIWQAILKRDPAHQAARAGLYRVKLALDQKNGAWSNERLLQEGCALYDLGQAGDALRKWEQILAVDPGHKLAIAYANDARRDLGLPPRRPPQAAAAPEAATGAARIDVDQLVHEGVQLYDLGMAEEAMVKWRRALELQPGHQDAREYLVMARRDQEQEAARPQAPSHAPDRDAAPERETRIWRAEQFLRERRLEDAARAFQQLLDEGSQDARILQGYHQARTLLAARDEAPRPVPLSLAEPPARPAIPPAVGPPRALTVRPLQRDGFGLPGALSALRLPPWFRTTRALAVAIGLGLLVVAGLAVYGLRRREAALRSAVAAAKQNALKPVSRLVDIPSLIEPVEAIRKEAEEALAEDPLLAYFRAQEWRLLDPENPAATLLVQRSKDKLTYLPVTATLADFDKALQARDLESANRAILVLLRHDPDDLDLRGRARKVLLALAPLYAADDRMGKAREALRLGQAMFPQDLTWPARLKLLEAIQDMAKPDRTPWIQLLG